MKEPDPLSISPVSVAVPEVTSGVSPALPAGRGELPATGPSMPVEIGGRGGAEPTRFGDWEKGGRCIDF